MIWLKTKGYFHSSNLESCLSGSTTLFFYPVEIGHCWQFYWFPLLPSFVETFTVSQPSAEFTISLELLTAGSFIFLLCYKLLVWAVGACEGLFLHIHTDENQCLQITYSVSPRSSVSCIGWKYHVFVYLRRSLGVRANDVGPWSQVSVLPRKEAGKRPVGTKCVLAIEELLVKHGQWDGWGDSLQLEGSPWRRESMDDNHQHGHGLSSACHGKPERHIVFGGRSGATGHGRCSQSKIK